MKLLLKGHNELYAVEQLQLALFPGAPDTDRAVSTLHRGRQVLTSTAEIEYRGASATARRRLHVDKADTLAIRRLLQNAYYAAAVQLIPAPEWGSLSGVRPTKLSTKHLLAGGTAESAQRMLQETYFVSAARSRLCVEASQATIAAASQLRERDVSLYIGIPFCPTRCAYCSFYSQSVECRGRQLEDYLDALGSEIAHIGKRLHETGRTVRTLYIGGGTPTTLSASQLRLLLKIIEIHVDLSSVIEYTIECGRPDTLDEEKLRSIADFGCNRISINPQTMNELVLAGIGRGHTGLQTLKAYRTAQAVGFQNINMDLIAGLPGDTSDSFRRSLEQIIALDPASITVHTLALKKGAPLFAQQVPMPTADAVGAMLDSAQLLLREAGYRPYYLYRQKYMSGSFENIGWCKPGFESLYNICMMEELHSIFGAGAGSMTKINLPDGSLERYHNPKFPRDYIRKIDDIRRQKFML